MPADQDEGAGWKDDARAFAAEVRARNSSLGWFEDLYAASEGNPRRIPWADQVPNPHVVAWLDHNLPEGVGRTALVVGCGLGDDAAELARRGFQTTAFDISSTAVRWGAGRFPNLAIDWTKADLLRPPRRWSGAYDLVIEAYTLQVLPVAVLPWALKSLAGFLGPLGKLLLVSRGRDPEDADTEPPRSLTRRELQLLVEEDLIEVSFEDFYDRESPPKRRFRAVYKKERVADRVGERR